jgi:hypothetical protein
VNRTIGFSRIRVATSQKRTYRKLQIGISSRFQRPMSAHFTRIGRTQTPTNIALPNRTDRRYRPIQPEPAEIHM